MKTRLLALLVLALPFSSLAVTPVEKSAPLPTVTTVKRSAIQVGNSSFALVKGTKLEVISREGKMLLVKYRTSQGKIPYADTDYALSAEEQLVEEEAAAAESPVPPAPVKPTPAPVAKAAPATPAPAAKATPPALSLDQKPATNYGKAVQKARQVEQAHKEKLVNPTDEILDEKPKK